MRPILWLILLTNSIDAWPLEEVIGDMRDSNAVIQVRILPKSAFNLADMKEVAAQFLRSDGEGHDVAMLSLYGDRDVAARNSGMSCEGGYRQWKAYFDGFPKGPLMAADVISIRKDAVLRLRTADGIVIRHVMSGKDPTLFSVDGIEFEILSLAGRPRSRFEGCGVPGSLDPILNLKTKTTLNENLCQRVTSALAARLGSKFIWAHFRNDHWFLCDHYGIQYPFSSLEQPPSEAEYYRSPEYTCSSTCTGAPHCIETTPTLSSPGKDRR